VIVAGRVVNITSVREHIPRPNFSIDCGMIQQVVTAPAGS